MIRLIYRRDPGLSWVGYFWWIIAVNTCRFFMSTFYRVKFFDTHHVPREGPVLYVVNHQSMYDPVLASVGQGRRALAFFAKESLFHNKYFGFLIRSLNAIPVSRGGGGDRNAIKQCLELVKQGRVLLIFPEGTRHTYGPLVPFQPGTLLIIKKAKPTIVPIAIDGCRHAWPKGGKPKFFKKIGVKYGAPITSEQVLEQAEPLEFLRGKIEVMRQDIETRLGLEPGKLPDDIPPVSLNGERDGQKGEQKNSQKSEQEGGQEVKQVQQEDSQQKQSVS